MSTQLVLDPSTPIGPLARHYPQTIPIFERLDIDFACFGGRSIADAAVATGADVGDLVSELKDTTKSGAETERALPDIVHQIITEHHNMERDLIRDLVRRLSPTSHPDPDAARVRRLLGADATVPSGGVASRS